MTHDLVIIGGGPGGYVCAIRAAQLGLKVACVERRPTLGGTCLNVGCIPSKALLQSSHLYHMAGHGMAEHGIDLGAPKLDLAAMMARKDKVVDGLTKGIDQLFKKNKVERIAGSGRLLGGGRVEVTPEEGESHQLEAKHIVIATGSEVTPLPGVEIDEKTIVSSTGALAFDKVPGHLVVIGAGVIGLELGSVWARLGAEVTVIEYLDHVLPFMDGEVRKQAQRLLARQGLTFRLGHKVTGAKVKKGKAELTVEPSAGGEAETITADKVLVAIGRRPVTEGLDLATAGVKTDERGFIQVDDHFATATPGIHAIGDVIGGMMLAHKAEEEGVALAEQLAGQAGHVNYEVIPSVVYTHPEIAAVGQTEEMLKKAGIAYKAGKVPFAANSRARCNGDADGFVKLLADAETDRLLGAHIIGPEAGDLLQEVVTAMEFSASAEDLARTCHSHPALGESLKEAALAIHGRTINL
ncbi:dihydrolipoyl dehydrogenase [Roseospirillum parvum]|uniref:Dihydrolipoyl dehydrogenase n=1 Tax=Roseospirillum parvum TaxID=83401 RepID=A0A1G8AUF6_9PROT|nr:dihydrolipoyl dehydrogenase [Roseospirillum parvum]SDH24484.1 dihydrolipoamide dehydrogenase [Roseospirillum parvum]